MNKLSTALLGVLPILTTPAYADNALRPEFKKMVEAVMADEARFIKRLMSDETAVKLCEVNGVTKTASRYPSLPRVTDGLGSVCERSKVALPAHSEGVVVCSFDMDSSLMQEAALSLVLNTTNSSNLEEARGPGQFLPPDDSTPYDFKNDPRCKAVELSFAPGNFTYEDKYPGAGCGSPEVIVNPPLSESELKILRNSYCNQ